MKLSELKKVSQKDYEKIEPGAVASMLITLLPQLIYAITPIVGLIKSSISNSGEMKTKEATYKWDYTKDKTSQSDSLVIF
ncbi:hypothetical protein HUN03_00031 [Mycoplasmopsis anatis]|uniref:Uncharacterized protein n=2 Tax=Mycoplasmopsis anatis TaxID=171279 RepID=F9QEA7_9BACT|nr:hypothetical protein [Mycoplasmopsis anatis]AWX70441.1 hypothetical protein DP067_03755 [Mycoplasmopsis anatis]EGS28918.1 hypothetical protein GIG_03592 [Mycoplasmopsis anatis 1340]MBW0594606.1 hypothetical protein [Mycoplasmopsis anatis]MBW0595464.1 hypothetical protein [Mycoplasmopsis anatis]MBW0596314.1 hypothetical protein [Mycoplasmopsis anatis]